MTNEMNNMFVRLALHHWDSNNLRAIKFLEDIPRDLFHSKLAPNGNTPSWIMGHLTETNDGLFPL